MLSSLQQLLGKPSVNNPENPSFCSFTMSTTLWNLFCIPIHLYRNFNNYLISLKWRQFTSIRREHRKCGPPAGFSSQHKYSWSLLNLGSLTLILSSLVSFARKKNKGLHFNYVLGYFKVFYSSYHFSRHRRTGHFFGLDNKSNQVCKALYNSLRILNHHSCTNKPKSKFY